MKCLGNGFPGRVAASLLSAVGLPQLMTRSWDEYIEAAYTAMWERYQRGEPTEAFAVDPSAR